MGWSGRHLDFESGWRFFLTTLKTFEGGNPMIVRKAFFGFCLATIHLFLVAQLLNGFDAKQLEQFRKTSKCQKCDLSNAKLANLDLSYVDLSSANLSGADLSAATLYGANLSGAMLVNANLSNANLYDADLSKADLKGANFAGANLYNATWPNGKQCKMGSLGTCKQ
jgi:hypothetical protein